MLKVINGNPGKRQVNADEPRAPGDLLAPLPSLTARQTEIWIEAAQAAPAGVLRHVDQSVFAAWVVAYSIWEESAQKLAATGMIVKSPKGYPMQNPFMAILNRQAVLLMKAAAELGFTPSARSRVVAPPTAAAGDPWDDLAG